MDSMNKALDAVGTLAALVEALRKPAQNEDGNPFANELPEWLSDTPDVKNGNGGHYLTREQAEEMAFGELVQALSVGSVPCYECKKLVTLADCSDAYIYYDDGGDEPFAVVYCADCEASNSSARPNLWPLNRRSVAGASESSLPSLCIKLNREQVGETCPICGNHFIFHPGPQLYIDGTNDIVCEPCVCRYDDDMGDPTPLQVASKDMYEFFYFASAYWKRTMDKRSKT